ncbi:MAG TPA: di-heme oxidoredictase family protein [Blastocatellia bacterium]|nr:di-heme oxidoredictase family protein [Blastocatellia bacterium]
MKCLKILFLVLFAAALVSPFALTSKVEGQAATEAPTTDLNQLTDDLNNGFVSPTEFDVVKGAFEEVDGIPEGLGPCYNSDACSQCHQTPDIGGASQISEFRAGHIDGGGAFVDAPGGSLINDRALAAAIQERVSSADPVRTFRITLGTFGDGFVEAIANSTLQNNVAAQPVGQRGTLISVPVSEAPGQNRIGRFGWKDQQASLLSFSGDAYLNEMGITNRFNPTENTSNGNSVAAFDTVPDPEDTANDIDEFTEFMRALRAPSRLPTNAQIIQGQNLFDALGCDICHTPTFTTAQQGTLINGGAFTVPAALGSKIIHPFSDFALHNVGTGDGIVQNGGQGTANQVRTPPLWGLRGRIRLMHDGETLTVNEAILRHGGQAQGIRNNYNALAVADKQAVIAFLLSI